MRVTLVADIDERKIWNSNLRRDTFKGERTRENEMNRRDGEEAKGKMRAARSERDVFLRVLYFLRYGSRELIFFCENSAQI